MKTWKRRWFILTDSCLYYFEFTTVSQQQGVCGLLPGGPPPPPPLEWNGRRWGGVGEVRGRGEEGEEEEEKE